MRSLIETVNIGLGRLERWWLHWGDDGRKKLTVETEQDAEPIVRANRRAFNDAPARFRPGGFMHRVARIPATVVEDYARKRGIPFGEFMAGKTDRAKAAWAVMLNDRDFRAFRTRPGRI